MKKVLVVFTLVASLFVFVGCGALTATAPVVGFLYADMTGTAENVAVNLAASTGSQKEGTAECTSILGWVGTGNCSVSAAKKAGSITSVQEVDYHVLNIVGVYVKYTVIVKGQ